MIKGKEIKAKRNSRKRRSLLRRKNDKRKKRRRTNKCSVLSGDLCVLCRLRTVMLIAAVLFGMLMVVTGCGAVRLPKPLMQTERTRLAESHFDLAIGVIREQHRSHLSSARVVRAIQRLKLFDRVDNLDA